LTSGPGPKLKASGNKSVLSSVDSLLAKAK
jgi:hypothetical protein